MRAGWMRPSAISRSMACLAISRRYGIETREDDRARRVVDDEIDAGRELERADVAPLAADDAPLEIVARQVHDRDGRLNRVLGAAALNRLGDVLLGAVDRGLARFGVEPLQQVRRIVTRLALDLPDQQLLRLVGGQSGDALELVLLLRDQLLRIWLPRPRPSSHAGCSAWSRAASSFSSRSMAPWRSAAADSRRNSVCSSVDGLLAIGARLTLRLHQDVVRLLLGFEQRFFLGRFGVAFGVPGETLRLLFGAADGVGGDALAVGDPDGEHRRRPRSPRPRRGR